MFTMKEHLTMKGLYATRSSWHIYQKSADRIFSYRHFLFVVSDAV